MHLRVVLAGKSKDVDHVSIRPGLSPPPSVNDSGHLHSAAGALGNGHLYVVRHRFGLHHHPGVVARDVQYPDKRTGVALHDCDNLTLAAGCAAGLLVGHCDTDKVPVQGTARLGNLHEDPLLLPVYLHIDGPLAGHLGYTLQLTDEFRGTFLSAGALT